MPPSKLILALIAAVVGVGVTFSLGMWQTRRGDEKLALQAKADAAKRATPFEISRSRASLDEAAAALPRKVRVSGVFDRSGTVYLNNRLLDGVPGYYVITPLVIGEEAPAVLIDRGWAPRNAGVMPNVAAPTGRVSIEGIAVARPSALLELGRAPEHRLQGLWQNLDYEAYELVAKRTVAHFVVRQTGESAADGLRREWPQPASGVARHRGYAFQWFALAALIATLGVYFGWKALVKR